MTPSALLLSLFLTQEPDSETVLEYSAAMAEEGAAPAPESFEFTAFEAGRTVYLGVDEGNLRANAAADAAVVQTLMLGTPVKVVKAGTRAKVGEYVNTWYQVAVVDAKAPAGAAPVTGWVFGNTLTPFRIEADLDGDGEMEVATVVMSNEFKARVRVLEPNVKPPRRVSSVDVQVASTAYGEGHGGPVKMRLVPAKKAGVALLEMESTPERCGDFITTYVSYMQADGKKAKGVLGKAKLALEAAGLSDAPNFSTFKVAFQAAAKQAVVTRKTVEEEEEGKAWTVTAREVYQWNDGVFTKVKKP
ncbi:MULTISPECIES: SH3 domain-containing protein [Corallococcus]|uniref:SH3 domain-containing protein n=1 Tax=Corallococcus TaxID=83461 RepID=UPI001C12F640|nr:MULTISPECIES: SH3 domain-containing protein [Corallococcus]